MAQLLLYRGGVLVGIVPFTIGPLSQTPPPTWSKHYMRPPRFEEPLDPNTLVETFVEIFERNLAFRCPYCDSYIYNSKNYMEGPDWFQTLLFDKQLGGL